MEDIETFTKGRMLKAAFKHLRPAWDSLLNNHARTAKGFDAEEHIREMARLGFTHVEVNGLAATFPYEHAAQMNCCIDSTLTARHWISSSTVN